MTLSGEKTSGRIAFRVGLVADTHGLFEPRLKELLAWLDEILHAGDVGGAPVLRELGRLAPVFAVRGNMDAGPGAPADAVLVRRFVSPRTQAALTVLVTHHVADPCRPPPALAAIIERDEPAVIVCGHTHLPALVEASGRLFVNPGSCGPRRGDKPRTCAVLTLTEAEQGLRPAFAFYDVDTGRPIKI
jgi:putative phosphoesterase